MLALVGLLLSLYLSFWKLGLVGSLACGVGSCEEVQLSEYAVIAGVPVAFLGVVGYLVLLVVSLVGVQPRWIERRGPTAWLAVVSGAGTAFSAYLTYLEAAVIHAWCRWCVVSAIVILAIFVTSVIGLATLRTLHISAVTTPLHSDLRAS